MSILSDLLSECVCDAKGLGEALELSEGERSDLEDIIKTYPARITPYYLSLINKEDRSDPIRKLCLPGKTEFSEGGFADTSGEALNTVVTGMQHKYKNTVLILSTGSCAVYCRHCFRKRMVGVKNTEVAESIPDMVSYVKANPEIDNILISGGDAFASENTVIRDYLEAFSAIESVKFIRFGTRIPVVMPKRIYEDQELLEILREYSKRKKILVITQFDHPREITEEAKKAVDALNLSGIAVRNQTVLLKDINDSEQVLSKLMNALVCINVAPYYVFQCRPVLGVKNQFQVPLIKGEEILRKTKGLLSGVAGNFRYVMSHPSGKIEIVGRLDDRLVFRYHEARDPKDQGRVFLRHLTGECWLEDDRCSGSEGF